MKYFKKIIIKYINWSIYVTEPEGINDERIAIQSLTDKENVFTTLKNQFIKTCLFLINKSYTLNTEEDKVKITNNLFKNISIIEKEIEKNDMNITFFSGKHFIYFLEIYYYYVEILEKNPFRLINKLFNENNNKFFIFGNIKDYIENELSIIGKKFELDLGEDSKKEDELQISEQFIKKIQQALDKRYQIEDLRLTRLDENKIIKKLYIINKLKRKIFGKLFI